MRTTSNQLDKDLRAALISCGVTPTQNLLDAIFRAAGASSITDQQFAVLRAAISGEQDKQIADQLGIHINTVQLHWHEIRRRIGIASKFQLGAFVVAATCVNTHLQSPRKMR